MPIFNDTKIFGLGLFVLKLEICYGLVIAADQSGLSVGFLVSGPSANPGRRQSSVRSGLLKEIISINTHPFDSKVAALLSTGDLVALNMG